MNYSSFCAAAESHFQLYLLPAIESGRPRMLDGPYREKRDDLWASLMLFDDANSECDGGHCSIGAFFNNTLKSHKTVMTAWKNCQQLPSPGPSRRNENID